jgi:hypothetical protein
MKGGSSGAPGHRGFLLFLVLLGVAARCLQYFSRSSLWLDEAALALNLASRPFRELFTPLDLAQVAPWGFLAIEKGLSGSSAETSSDSGSCRLSRRSCRWSSSSVSAGGF